MVLCLAAPMVAWSGELAGSDDSGNRNVVAATASEIVLTITASAGDANSRGGHLRYVGKPPVDANGNYVHEDPSFFSGGESVSARMDYFNADGSHAGTEFASATIPANGVGSVTFKFTNPTKSGVPKLCAFQAQTSDGGFILPAWTNEIYFAKADRKHPTGHKHKLMAVVAGEIVSSVKSIMGLKGWKVAWDAHQDLIREAQKKGGGGLKSVDDL